MAACCHRRSDGDRVGQRADALGAGHRTDRVLVEDRLVEPSFLWRLTSRCWKSAAIGRFRNSDTIRTDQYRFTQYTKPGGQPIATMLYDHVADPAEDVNISERPENRPVVRRLRGELHEGMGKDGEMTASE